MGRGGGLNKAAGSISVIGVVISEVQPIRTLRTCTQFDNIHTQGSRLEGLKMSQSLPEVDQAIATVMITRRSAKVVRV